MGFFGYFIFCGIRFLFSGSVLFFVGWVSKWKTLLKVARWNRLSVSPQISLYGGCIMGIGTGTVNWCCVDR